MYSKLKTLLICIALAAVTLSGCGKTSSPSPEEYDVEEVRCVFNYGDQDGAELDIFKADGTVTQYIITPYSDSGIDMFAGEIPSDSECEKKESTISGDEWETIVAAVKDSDFFSLPEELPKVEAYDGSTCYIEIVTTAGNHRSGGYCAGNGSGKEHERFYSVRSLLRLDR